MKKLITLLLVLTGMVLTASAGTKTIRIYTERQTYDGWGDKMTIFAQYYNGSTNVELIPRQEMVALTASSGGYMFYKDVTLDEDLVADAMSKYGIKFQFNNGYSAYTTEWELKDVDFFNKNHIFFTKNDEGFKHYHDTFTYKFAKAGNESSISDVVVLSNVNNVLTTTVDHQTATSDAYYVLYPSFAASDTKINYWDLTIRPVTASGNFAINNFQDYNDDIKLGSANGLIGIFIPVTVDFTFNIETLKWSAELYYTREVTSASEGYATFGYAFDAHVKSMPDGAEVKYASNITDGSITWTAFTNNDIPAYAGALLKGVGAYKFVPSASALSSLDENTDYLRGQIENAQKKYDQYDGRTLYVLTKVDDNIGFYKAAADPGSWLNPNTAYLNVPNGKIPSARDFFALDDETTGIEAVKAEQKLNGEYFNLAGQRVAQPTKGMYIVNGKKVVIK